MRSTCLLFAAVMLFGSLAEAGTRAQRKQVMRNKRDGTRREKVWAGIERVLHPLSSVQRERDLLDRRGKKIADRKTGKGRRFDIAVISRITGRVSALVEVTGPDVGKKAQEAKSERILNRRGGVYIRDKRNGKLRRVRAISLTSPVSWLRPTWVRTERLSLTRTALAAGALGGLGAGALTVARNPGLLTSLAALF